MSAGLLCTVIGRSVPGEAVGSKDKGSKPVLHQGHREPGVTGFDNNALSPEVSNLQRQCIILYPDENRGCRKLTRRKEGEMSER
jgi:hypothetical protein